MKAKKALAAGRAAASDAHVRIVCSRGHVVLLSCDEYRGVSSLLEDSQRRGKNPKNQGHRNKVRVAAGTFRCQDLPGGCGRGEIYLQCCKQGDARACRRTCTRTHPPPPPPPPNACTGCPGKVVETHMPEQAPQKKQSGQRDPPAPRPRAGGGKPKGKKKAKKKAKQAPAMAQVASGPHCSALRKDGGVCYRAVADAATRTCKLHAAAARRKMEFAIAYAEANARAAAADNAEDPKTTPPTHVAPAGIGGIPYAAVQIATCTQEPHRQAEQGGLSSDERRRKPPATRDDGKAESQLEGGAPTAEAASTTTPATRLVAEISPAGAAEAAIIIEGGGRFRALSSEGAPQSLFEDMAASVAAAGITNGVRINSEAGVPQEPPQTEEEEEGELPAFELEELGPGMSRELFEESFPVSAHAAKATDAQIAACHAWLDTLPGCWRQTKWPDRFYSFLSQYTTRRAATCNICLKLNHVLGPLCVALVLLAICGQPTEPKICPPVPSRSRPRSPLLSNLAPFAVLCLVHVRSDAANAMHVVPRLRV